MKYIIIILRIVAALVFFYAGMTKFLSGVSDVAIFVELGMEPHGRYIIGALEIVAGFFLLTNQMTAWGSFLGLGIMLGALIAHLTVLGLDVNSDGGFHSFLLAIQFLSFLLITWDRKEQLPFLSQK